MSRDRDVRNAVKDALVATGAFDAGGVWLFPPEDLGQGTDITRAAWIDPVSSSERDEWDAQTGGGITISSIVTITFAFRAEDPQARDEGAEHLLDSAANALNGQSLAGLTLPAWTRITAWTWLKPTPPERQIVSSFTYQYIVEGWDAFDTTE